MQEHLKDIANGMLASTNAPVEVRTSAKAIGVMLTCIISAVFSVGGYVANIFTDSEAETLEKRIDGKIENIDDKIDRLDIRLSDQNAQMRQSIGEQHIQLLEIAKTVGAKQTLQGVPASLPAASMSSK
jgi:hypothetical protein